MTALKKMSCPAPDAKRKQHTGLAVAPRQQDKRRVSTRSPPKQKQSNIEKPKAAVPAVPSLPAVQTLPAVPGTSHGKSDQTNKPLIGVTCDHR